ncbi:MAG TPA: NADH-quinone oxidoreductase subunit J [Phycisphaerae bacterium]|nr:NADH-quinone oxidoreductase subunit J [Phycisphaerae bacterium]HNU44918.1 NADH-quinone oxidoreductase subunit J [Phycisphaerae bacterium]
MTVSTSYLLYLVFAVGGVGVYLLLPRAQRSARAAGTLLALAALAALLVVLAVRMLGPGPTAGYFYVFATVALAAAVRVVTHPRPVHCALYFVLVVVAVAALLVLQRAEFLAIALIIIYAGAILVTYVFVIMLAQQRGDAVYDTRAREPLLGVLAGFVLMAAMAGQVDRLPLPRPSAASPFTGAVLSISPQGLPAGPAQLPGNTLTVGQLVMTKYVVVLEMTGVLLLVAIIGAVALSGKRVPVDQPPPTWVVGKIGKEVKPF